MYNNDDSTAYQGTQITYSQALQKVSGCNTPSEGQDTSTEHVSTHDVSRFTLKIFV